MPRAGDIECDEALFAALRALRKQLADDRSVPPYVIFSDVALRHMARQYPQTDEAFLAIPGVGARKLADFGGEFMSAVRGWLQTHARRDFEVLKSAAAQPAAPRVLTTGSLATLQRYESGESIDQICAGTGLARSTVSKHLADAIASGKLTVSPRDFYSAEVEQAITAAAEIHGLDALKPLRDALGEHISYETLHFYRAFAAMDGG